MQTLRPVLPLVLALTAALPSYVGCSSFDVRLRLLGPLVDEVAPTNTAVWFLESVVAPDVGRPRLLDGESGEPIETIELTIPLRNGLLVELRPYAELLPMHRYAIEIGGLDPIEFTTDLGADRIRPQIPEVMESEETPPLAHCLRSASILVHTKTSEMGDFLLATNSAQGDLAISRDEALVVPASQGERLSISVIAMDLAGNRSPPAVPIDASAGGCRTTKHSDALLLSLLSISLLAKRRKR